MPQKAGLSVLRGRDSCVLWWAVRFGARRVIP